MNKTFTFVLRERDLTPHNCGHHIGDENYDEMYPLFCKEPGTVVVVMLNSGGSQSHWQRCDSHLEDSLRECMEQYPYRPVAYFPIDA